MNVIKKFKKISPKIKKIFQNVKLNDKNIRAFIISTNRKMVKLLKNNCEFIKLKDELKKNTNKINYDKLIVFLNNFNDESIYVVIFNFLKFFFSKSKYKKLKCKIIEFIKIIVLDENIKLLYGKYYNWCYIDDFGKVVYNNSLLLTSNNYNNYINNKIPFPNEIYKDSCSKNECNIIKKKYILITSNVGSLFGISLKYIYLAVIIIVAIIIILLIYFYAPAIFLYIASTGIFDSLSLLFLDVDFTISINFVDYNIFDAILI